jgi:hypothetical protein
VYYDGEPTEAQKCGFGALNRRFGTAMQVGHHGRIQIKSAVPGSAVLSNPHLLFGFLDSPVIVAIIATIQFSLRKNNLAAPYSLPLR